MKQRLQLLLTVGIVPLATSCAMTEQAAMLPRVGPSMVGEAQPTQTGFLKVYTSVKTYPVDAEWFYRVHSNADPSFNDIDDYRVGSQWFYRVHTDYSVYASDGAKVMSVRNTARYRDLKPKLVSLPPGDYTVKGWADRFGLVKVPVEIKAGRVTVVNLEADQNQRFADVKSDELVAMSGGRIIGWSPDIGAAR